MATDYIFKESLLRLYVFREEETPDYFTSVLVSWTTAPREQLIKGIEKLGFKKRKIMLRPYMREAGDEKIYISETDEIWPLHLFIKSGFRIQRNKLQQKDLKPALHSIVDLYEEIVDKIDDIDFVYCKEYMRRMRTAIDKMDIRDIGFEKLGENVGNPLTRYWE